MTFHDATALILLLLGGLLAAGNAWNQFRTRRTGHWHSPVPLLGGLFLSAGLFMLPATRPFAWSGLLLDYGTLAVGLALPKIGREWWRTRPCHLLSEYAAGRGNRTVRLRLFRHGLFTLQLQWSRAPEEVGLISAGAIGGWRETDACLTLHAEDGDLAILVRSSPGTLCVRDGFAHWERNPDLALTGTVLIRRG